MADNVEITEGSGKTIAADDIGSVLFQRIKLVLGADGVNAGDVSASNPLPISGSVSVTSLPTLPAGDNNIGNVDIVSMPAITGTVSVTGSVTVAATDLDIRNLVFATDKVDASGTVLGAGSNNIGDVDIASMPSITGTVSISGSVTVTATNLDIRDLTFAADKVDASGSVLGAGDNNIGNVDIVTMPAITGTVTANLGTLNGAALDATLQSILTELGQKTEPADTQTVSGTVSVSGSVAVTATNLDIRDLVFATDKVDASGTVLGASSNNIGDVDVLTLPALPAGTNKIGSVDLDSDATIAAAVPTVAQFVAGTDGTNARGLKTDASGELQIDVLTLPAITGSVSISGSVAVTATDLDIRDLTFAADKVDASGTVLGASSNNIGDVDVLTLPAITGTVSISGSVTVTATDLDIRNLVFATDKVDASGTVLGAGTNNIGDVDVLTLPAITGSVTANAGTNLNTSALALETSLAKLTIAQGAALGINTQALAGGSVTTAAPSYTTGQVSPLSLTTAGDLRVALATVPSHAVTNAGTFAVQVDGAALTALQLIDDTVFADDAAFTPGTSKVLGVGYIFDDVSSDTVDEGDIGAARMNKVRAQGAGPLSIQTTDLSTVNTTYNATTTQTGADIDCDGYSQFALSFKLVSASTPTEFQLIVEFKDEDGNYLPYQNGFWGRLKFEDTEVSSVQSYSFSSRSTGGIPPGMKTVRLRCVAVGTDGAGKEFTLSEAKFGFSTI